MLIQNNQTALITGASSGIGLELAKLFALDGYKLILVSSHGPGLQKAADTIKNEIDTTGITIIAKDLSKHGASEELYNEVKAMGHTVNVLVNDAGVGEYGQFSTTDLQAEVDLVHLNIISLMSLTKLYLREMLLRNEGRILQLASIASFLPHPWLAVYAASKAFVLSFSEAVQHEIKDTEVKITILCPGATDTNFFSRAGAANSTIAQEMNMDDPAEVAKEGYEALKAGKKRVIVGIENRAQIAASNLIPDSALAAMMDKQLQPVEL